MNNPVTFVVVLVLILALLGVLRVWRIVTERGPKLLRSTLVYYAGFALIWIMIIALGLVGYLAVGVQQCDTC
jgi:hypothetical protein